EPESDEKSGEWRPRSTRAECDGPLVAGLQQLSLHPQPRPAATFPGSDCRTADGGEMPPERDTRAVTDRPPRQQPPLKTRSSSAAGSSRAPPRRKRPQSSGWLIVPSYNAKLDDTMPALLTLVLLAIGQPPESPLTPLRRAHAHNDDEHKRLLFDALDQGFC